MAKNKAAVLFGDDRQKYLSDYLMKSGLDVIQIISEEMLDLIDKCNIVIYPMPMTKDGKNIYTQSEEIINLQEISDRVNEKHWVIYSGKEVEPIGKTEKYFNISKDEVFLYKNAALTAQGTLRLLLSGTQRALYYKKCLIVGYGRVGETLAKILGSIGCDVYICARNQLQREKARLFGYKAIDFEIMKNCIHIFDFIFGTVPQNVIGENAIKHIREDGIYFELASQPYCASPELFEKYGKTYIKASALPGRFTPVSAGEAMAESILSYLERQGNK